MEDIAFGLAAVVLRLLHRLQHRDDDLVVAVVGDGIGHLRIIRQAFHTLNGTSKDLLTLQRLHQIQQIIAQLIRIGLHCAFSVDGYHARTAPARHSELFPGLLGVGLGRRVYFFIRRLSRAPIRGQFKVSLEMGRSLQRICAVFRISCRFQIGLGAFNKVGLVGLSTFISFQVSLGTVGIQRCGGGQFQIGQRRVPRCSARFHLSLGQICPSGRLAGKQLIGRGLNGLVFLGSCHGLCPPLSDNRIELQGQKSTGGRELS